MSAYCKETVKLFGGVSALVTAAGYYEEELLADVTEAAFDEMFGTNVKVRFLCASGIALFARYKGQYRNGS